MALIEMELSSEALGMKTTCMVILPEKEVGIGMSGGQGAGAGYPVLYLLHGASDDCSIWLRRTSVERYVSSLGLAVIMPQVQLSRYHNMRHGPRYFDYIADELPRVASSLFPISIRRQDTFIAGLSMGGYGALMLAMARPEQYAATGCFSAGNMIYMDNPARWMAPRPSGHSPVQQAVYGTTDYAALRGDLEFDPFAMAEAALAAGKQLPRIYHGCGTEDGLLENARTTAKWYRAHPAFDYTYEECPGAHTWEVWDGMIQRYLAFIGPQLGA